MKVLIIVEPTESGFSADSPALPGCVGPGPDRESAAAQMGAAIAFHLRGLPEAG